MTVRDLIILLEEMDPDGTVFCATDGELVLVDNVEYDTDGDTIILGRPA